MAESHDHIACREIVELVTDYLEGALSPERTVQFERHIELCDGCERYLEQMRATIAAVGRIDEADMPGELRDRLLTAFRERDRA